MVRPMGLLPWRLSWLCGLGKALNLSKPLVEWGAGPASPGGCGWGKAGGTKCSQVPSRAGAVGSAQSGSYGASPEWPSRQGPRPAGGSSLWRLAMSAMMGPHPTPRNPTASASARQKAAGLLLLGGRCGAAVEAGRLGCRDQAGLRV